LLLHELVVGERPYGTRGQPSHEYARAILEDDVRIPRTVPADLAAIIRLALRKEPDRRYVSADQFAEDVRRFRRGRPVMAQPETWTYQLRTFLKRHYISVATAAGVAIALIVLTTVAVRQAHRADEQRARAEQVTTFITGFLGATPSGPDFALQYKGVSLRVVELADLIEQRLGANTTLQPEAEQTLRGVLAMTYFQMGEMAKSQQNAQRAIDLCDQLYGPNDPRRFPVELVLGSVDNNLGRFAEAEARLSRIAANWRDASPQDRASVATQLGGAQWRLGKPDLAEQTIRDGIARAETALGETHPILALPTSYLGLVYLERGQFDQAVVQFERSAAISRSVLKEASMPLAWALVNLANAYRFLGKNEELLRTAEESHAQFTSALGEGHFSNVHALAFMAYAKANRGDADAEAIARQAVAVQASLPADHYERAVGLTFLGFVLMKKHELGEARTSLERALQLRRTAFKAPNWRIAETAGWLGEVLAMQGDRNAARPLLEESVAMFMALYGPSNPRTLEAQARLSRAVP
jgi:serine/threonine-protein kinase